MVTARLARAEQRWRKAFERRASVMRGALKLATNEELPTPYVDIGPPSSHSSSRRNET